VDAELRGERDSCATELRAAGGGAPLLWRGGMGCWWRAGIAEMVGRGAEAARLGKSAVARGARRGMKAARLFFVLVTWGALRDPRLR
jgi:hypothetical protein